MYYSERNSLSSAAPIAFHSLSSSFSIGSRSTESCELSPKSKSSVRGKRRSSTYSQRSAHAQSQSGFTIFISPRFLAAFTFAVPGLIATKCVQLIWVLLAVLDAGSKHSSLENDSSLTENVEYLVLNVYDTMENFVHKVDNDKRPKNEAHYHWLYELLFDPDPQATLIYDLVKVSVHLLSQFFLLILDIL
ncbi:hypothetical protein V1478_001712 [Vespula squamosa]|uniref:Uncharacterized protein n=1 Tax=Vespula squamosa TaxID=30214 RepID=A0ABD2BXY2_VESSQ